MKSLLYPFICLLSANVSSAQAPGPDSSNHLIVRSNSYYYIDGIKVHGKVTHTKTSLQEVSIITGGIPVNYGDLRGSIISIGPTPAPVISRKTADKEQKMATE